MRQPLLLPLKWHWNYAGPQTNQTNRQHAVTAYGQGLADDHCCSGTQCNDRASFGKYNHQDIHYQEDCYCEYLQLINWRLLTGLFVRFGTEYESLLYRVTYEEQCRIDDDLDECFPAVGDEENKQAYESGT